MLQLFGGPEDFSKESVMFDHKYLMSSCRFGVKKFNVPHYITLLKYAPIVWWQNMATVCRCGKFFPGQQPTARDLSHLYIWCQSEWKFETTWKAKHSAWPRNRAWQFFMIYERRIVLQNTEGLSWNTWSHFNVYSPIVLTLSIAVIHIISGQLYTDQWLFM